MIEIGIIIQPEAIEKLLGLDDYYNSFLGVEGSHNAIPTAISSDFFNTSALYNQFEQYTPPL